MYSDKILELFKNPINAGGLQGANGVGKYVDNACGDNLKIYLKIDEYGVICEARFKALGSAGTIVACSAICSCLLDCTIDEARAVDTNRIQEITGEYPHDKMYCLDYAVKAVDLAIVDYFEKLEKALKKAEKEGKQLKQDITSDVSVEQKSQDIKSDKEQEIVSQRRTVSAAKAAFDAMFE